MGAEIQRDVLEHKDQREEVECVERPAQEGRSDHMPLLTGPAGFAQ